MSYKKKLKKFMQAYSAEIDGKKLNCSKDLAIFKSYYIKHECGNMK